MKRTNTHGIQADKVSKQSVARNKVRIRPSALARKLLLKGENWREFEEMRTKTLSEVGPRNEIENMLCEKIISTAWKMRRAMIVERNLLNQENEITFEERHPDPWELPSKIRKRIRNINKVHMQSPEVQNILQLQNELGKSLQKTLDQLLRIRDKKDKNEK